MNWLKHAFDTSGPDGPPSAEEMQLVEKLCREVVRRRLALPALVFLEMSRPLNTLSAQAIHFLAPMLGMFGAPREVSTSPPNLETNPAVGTAAKPAPTHELLAHFLQRPDAIELLCSRIDVMEKEFAGSQAESVFGRQDSATGGSAAEGHDSTS